MTTVTKEIKTEKKIYIVGQSPLLCCLSEGHAGEAVRETLRVHLTARALQVVVLPGRHVGTLHIDRVREGIKVRKIKSVTISTWGSKTLSCKC